MSQTQTRGPLGWSPSVSSAPAAGGFPVTIWAGLASLGTGGVASPQGPAGRAPAEGHLWLCGHQEERPSPSGLGQTVCPEHPKQRFEKQKQVLHGCIECCAEALVPFQSRGHRWLWLLPLAEVRAEILGSCSSGGCFLASHCSVYGDWTRQQNRLCSVAITFPLAPDYRLTTFPLLLRGLGSLCAPTGLGWVQDATLGQEGSSQIQPRQPRTQDTKAKIVCRENGSNSLQSDVFVLQLSCPGLFLRGAVVSHQAPAALSGWGTSHLVPFGPFFPFTATCQTGHRRVLVPACQFLAPSTPSPLTKVPAVGRCSPGAPAPCCSRAGLSVCCLWHRHCTPAGHRPSP